MTKTDTQQKRIEAYNIADFVKQIQDAVLEGYKLNLEDNEKYPLQIGVGFYATLDKTETVSELVQEAVKKITENITEGKEIVQVLQSSKPGRKPKV